MKQDAERESRATRGAKRLKRRQVVTLSRWERYALIGIGHALRVKVSELSQWKACGGDRLPNRCHLTKGSSAILGPVKVEGGYGDLEWVHARACCKQSEDWKTGRIRKGERQRQRAAERADPRQPHNALSKNSPLLTRLFDQGSSQLPPQLIVHRYRQDLSSKILPLSLLSRTRPSLGHQISETLLGTYRSLRTAWRDRFASSGRWASTPLVPAAATERASHQLPPTLCDTHTLTRRPSSTSLTS